MVICWGFNFVSVKLIYKQMPASAMSLFRFLLMWGALVLICKFRGESLKVTDGLRGKIMFVGFLGMGVYMIPFLEGLAMTTPSECAIMLSTAPIFTALIAALFGQEKIKLPVFISTIVAFAGVAIVLLGGHHGPTQTGEHPLMGNALVLFASLIWAVATVMGKPLLSSYSPIQLLTLSLPGALPLLAIYGGRDLLKVHWSELTFVTWLNIAQVAFCSGALAFICFYEGVRQIGTARATMYQFFVPIVATFFGMLILHDTPKLMQIVGLAVVISGVRLAAVARQKAASSLAKAVEFPV